MKKTLLAIAFVVAAFSAMAQNNYNYRLDCYYADDELEIYNYFYSDGRCIAIESLNQLDGNLWVYDSLRYDQNGDLVRIDQYQYMDASEGWRHVNYCEYTYDNQHNMLTRTNYNNFGGTFEMGGVYHFEYDDQGRLASRWLYFMNMRFEESSYTYDAQGRIAETLYKIADYPSSTLIDYERVVYNYDGNNAGPSTVAFSYRDDNTGVLTPYKNEFYTYDAQGNCTLFESKTVAGLSMEKREYEMESRLLSETFIPHTFEHEKPETYTNHNTFNIMHWYMANDNDILTYVCDYFYEYYGMNAIKEADAMTLSLYPNPATTNITVTGLEGDRTLYIYSLNGQIVHMQRLSGNDVTVDVSNLASGVYVVRVDGQQTRTSKVTIK